MTWSIDGRSGLVEPPGEALDPVAFEQAVVDAVVEGDLIPFLRLGIPDELEPPSARRYHATWLTHMAFFSFRFPSFLMSIASRCPYQRVRREIIEDCIDEEVGDPGAGGMNHFEALIAEVEQCGMSREEFLATRPTPIMVATVNAWDNFSKALRWEVAYAAISALELGRAPRVQAERRARADAAALAEYDKRVVTASLTDRLGLTSDHLLFNALHAERDEKHGGGALPLLSTYATDAATQAEMLWAVRTSLELLGLMLGEIQRLARASVGLGPLADDELLGYSAG